MDQNADKTPPPAPVPDHNDDRHAALSTLTQNDKGEAERLAIAAALALKDARCDDVIVLDVRGKNPVTDYLVIGTGTSDRQMRTALDEADDAAEAFGYTRFNETRDASKDWLLSDYLQVVVHVFEANTRALYDLEMLWGDGTRVAWARKPGKDTV